jgi:hypothetical protein
MQQVTQSLKRIFAQPAFVVVAIILLVCAVGLNGATQFLQLHFKKLPVPLARPLNDVPQRIGPWVQLSIDQTITHEFEEVLGTDKYVFRDYVDSRLVSAKQIEEFKDKTPSQRELLLQQLQMNIPASVVNVSLTYYTGLVDTVAHIPDRCYVADGFEPTSYTVQPWSAMRGRPGDDQVRFIVFEDQTPNRGAVKKNVAYFFHCDGKYENDPIGVRKSLASLFEKYGYYMKIEVQTIQLKPDEGAKVMNSFLTDALPEIEKCLPDWQKISGGH